MRLLDRHPGVMRALWIVLLLAVWQGTVWSGRISPLLLPGIPAVASSLVSGVIEGQLVEQIGFSLGIICLGMLIALGAGLVMTLLAQWSRVLSSLTDTLCMLAHPLPAIALMPLIIVWFGTGTFAIGAIIVHSVLWPILLNLSAGFRAIPRVYVETGRTLGLSPLGLLFHVYLPAAATHLIAGIKIGWARAWRALISAEMIFGAVGGTGGVGWFLFRSRVMMDTPGMYAGIVVVICIGIAVEALLNLLERGTVVRWGMSAE